MPERKTCANRLSVLRRGRSGYRCTLGFLLPLVLLLSATLAAADLPQITIEAEDYSEVTGGTVRVLDRPEASGGQCVSYWEEPGVAVTCEFEVAQAGEYCLTLRYALNWPDTRREVRIDGEVVEGLDDVLLPTTGSWGDFRMMTLAGEDGGRARIPLEPGTHTLTLANVDSRGLSWDAATLHDPETLMADAPLSEEELAAFADRLPDSARRLLMTGPAQEDLSAGNVAMAFAGGMLQALKVDDVFFAMPREVQMPIEWEHHRLGPVALATVAVVPEEGHSLRGLLATNGSSFVTVAAGIGEHTMAGGRAVGLPSPLIAWRDGQPWRLALAPMMERIASGEVAHDMEIEDLTLSASGNLSAEMVDEPLPYLLVGWVPLVNDGLKVAAAKVGPALRPADARVRVLVEGEDTVVRSSTDMPPALARFYGIPQFEVRVHPDVSMTITTDAGETLALPAP